MRERVPLFFFLVTFIGRSLSAAQCVPPRRTRRRRTDGHQRRHDDLVHVPARRPDGRRGGLIYALYQTDVWFFASFTTGLISFTAAVMGGIGNLKGAILGGLLIGMIQQISDNRIGTEWTPAIVFAFLVLVLVFQPGPAGRTDEGGRMSTATATRPRRSSCRARSVASRSATSSSRS